MDTIKAGRPLIDFIEHCFRANRPPLLVGWHGIGKSELLEQAARGLGVHFISRDLSLMEPPDLIGLPQVNGERTVYFPPAFLPTSGQGLLVFEELNRCEKYVQAPCLQLLTARTLSDYRLPSGWLPAAAINPSDDEYHVNQLDRALSSRFVQVQVVPDREQWLDWARRSGVHAGVLRYVDQDATVFDHPDSNPRAWKYVSDLLHTAQRCQTSTGTLRAAVLGTVGDKRGAAFLQTLKQTERPLTADEITTAYDRHRQDAYGWIAHGRLDLVEMSLRSLLTFLQPQADYEAIRLDATRWARVTNFFRDLPGDLQITARNFFRERGYEFPIRQRRTGATL